MAGFGQPWEPLGQVDAPSAVERNPFVILKELDAPAIDLWFMQPVFSDRRPLNWLRKAGNDERWRGNCHTG
jgi:hypothetical protein